MGLIQSAYTLLKSLPALLRPRYGARRAMGSFLGHSSVGPWWNAWTDSRIEQVRHFNAWTYIAVDRIATTFAMRAPNVSLIRGLDVPGKTERYLHPGIRQKALTPLQAHEQLEVVPDNHPLVRLLNDPNEPDTSYDLLYESVMYLCLTGNCYWWMPPNKIGKPSAIWVLPSHWIFPRVDEQGAVSSFDLRPVEGNYLYYSIPAEDVIHFKKKSPISKVDGYSALTAGSRWIDTSESIDRTRWFTFRNGIFPGVGVEFDAGVKLPTEADLDRIEARLMSRYGGEQNTNRPVMIPPGAKLKQLQLTPGELLFCESSEQIRDQILALFGVPAAIAQPNSQGSYGALLAAQATFYQLTINPLYRFFGMHLTEKLAAPRYQRGLRVWWEDRTPQDPELLERQLNTDLAYGARTMNEVRSLRGLTPYQEPWGDVPWIPLNTVPIDRALEMGPGDGSQGRNRATQSDQGNTPRGGEAPEK